MTDKMVQITIEILNILAIATKEMKQSRASEFDLRFRDHDADIVSEKFVKRVIGRTDLEDGMKTLDKLTNEEVVMASAQLLKVAHKTDNNVTEVNENVVVVKGGVQLANDNIKAVYDRVQTIADSKQRLSASHERHLIFLLFNNGRWSRQQSFVINSSSLTIQFLTDRREGITGKS